MKGALSWSALADVAGAQLGWGMAQENSSKRPRSLSEAVAEVLPEAANRQVDGRSATKPPPLPKSGNAGPSELPVTASPPPIPLTVLAAEQESGDKVQSAPPLTATFVPVPPQSEKIPPSIQPEKAGEPAPKHTLDKPATPPTPPKIDPPLAAPKKRDSETPSAKGMPLPPPLQAAPKEQPRETPKEASAVDDDADGSAGGPRRAAKRRPAGPAPDRGKIAANDDIPTIGGLIYALEQKPSQQPFKIAAIASAVWFFIGGFFAWGMLAPELAKSASFAEMLTRPAILVTLATVFLPIAVFGFLAWLLYQAQDLRLRSSAMTEVAIRLAEPDRSAEQAVASLGQSVRKQLNFMNDAVSRAIDRAGELESMVHNEVSNLDRSFSDNEERIQRLIQQLANERNQLTSTSDQVHTTLRSMGEEVPALIEKLNGQQVKLAKIIEGAGQNLIALEGSLIKASGQLETSLGDRTIALQSVLTDNMGQMSAALTSSTEQLHGLLETGSERVQGLLVDRTNHLQTVLDEYTNALHGSLSARTDQFQTVFEEFTRALDTTLDGRAQALDTQLVERTRALDTAFAARLQVFDDSVRQSALTIDSTVGEKARALSNAMETHARQLAETLGRQSQNLDEQLMQGISAVRRTSENITRQSVKAIEGLSGQADMLRNVSENLLTQIGTVTSRFENQGQSIMRAANALENANYRIDQTLQSRHRELTDTLGRLTGTTDALDQQMQTYRTSLEGSLTDAEQRARLLTSELTRGAQTHAEQALSELQKLKTDTAAEASRAMEDMRSRFSSLGQEMSAQVGSLSSRLSETSDDLRGHAQRAADQFAREQEALRQQASRIPYTTRETAETMRRVLAEQMRALEQISSLAQRESAARDIQPPVSLPSPARPVAPPTPTLAAAIQSHTPPPAPQMQPPIQHHVPPPTSPQHPAPAQSVAGAQQRWSLGDLLARASQDDPPPQSRPPGPPVHHAVEAHHGANVSINLESISRALDAATANAIWTRFRSGQRGIMVRSIYTAEGRTTFDEVSRRYASEPEFRAMVDRFLSDFERVLRDTEQKDWSGQMLQGQLTSASGRVYLFLAHASGRLH